MAFCDTHISDRAASAHRPASPAREDAQRLALILMTFAVIALGIMLAADRPAEPGSPAAGPGYTGQVWHGNAAVSAGV